MRKTFSRQEIIGFEKGRWYETYKAPVIGKNDEPLGIVGFLRDITERKQTEEQVRKLYFAVEQSPVSIVITDIDGKIEYVNPKFTRLTGYTLQETVGKDFDILKSIETSQEEYKSLLETILGGNEWQGELHNRKKNGELYWELVNISPVKDKDNVIRNFISVSEDITQRKEMEEAVTRSDLRYHELIESMPVGYYKSTPEGTFVEINPAFCRMVGYSREELLTMNIPGTLYFAETERTGATRHAGFAPTTESYRLKKKNGAEVWIEDYARYVRDETGRIMYHEGLCTDITDRKSLQEQLLQSQKLESIGQLAGGVAHDFNNLLGVVIGYAQFLISKLEDDNKAKRPVNAILKAANRGADLTRQLLSFARKEMVSPKVINMNSSIESIKKMLFRIIGENRKLNFVPDSNLWNIKIDPSQFDQILINFAGNSRDAITGIGTITIRTANKQINDSEARDYSGIIPGDFVNLTFQDTGRGMDDATLKRIFEPFFTTKPKGQGTGLGLLTVYGIVKQNNGDISVTSIPGEGTTFEVVLPRCHGEAETEKMQPADESIRGAETILIVEDEADLLEITKTLLAGFGYRVLTALEPGEGLLLAETYTGPIHLLLTDVIMPFMSGKELSKKITVMRPGMKTLFMSGYTANELVPEGILKGDLQFLQKPFTPTFLARKVRESLNI